MSVNTVHLGAGRRAPPLAAGGAAPQLDHVWNLQVLRSVLDKESQPRQVTAGRWQTSLFL